jgi:hypothetical protein
LKKVVGAGSTRAEVSSDAARPSTKRETHHLARAIRAVANRDGFSRFSISLR